MQLPHGDLTQDIIGAAIAVHRSLGPGFIESIYSNALSIELRRHGLEVFERFAGKKDGTVWYYRTLVTAFRQHGDHSDLIDELDRVVSEIEKFVREH